MIGNYLHYSIPCEKRIKAELLSFHQYSVFKENYLLVGYDGLRSLSLAPTDAELQRHKHYQSVRALFSFASDCVPDMKNGHVGHNPLLSMRTTIERCLMITLPTGEVIAAAYFRINLALRRCLLANIAVHKTHQKRGLGAFLWHGVVLVSLLYGCSMLTGCAIGDGLSSIIIKKFYEKRGCEFHSCNRADISKMSVIDLIKLKLNHQYQADLNTISAYDMIQWVSNSTLADNEQVESQVPQMTLRHLADLRGFLIETDPTFEPGDTLHQENPLLVNSFLLHVTCEKKTIEYDIENECFIKPLSVPLSI